MNTYYCPGAGKMRGMRLNIFQRIAMNHRRRKWQKAHPQGIGW